LAELTRSSSDRPIDQRGRLLIAAFGLAACSLPSYDRALWALRTWLDSWDGIGHVTVCMARQGYDLQLTRYDEKGWRATFDVLTASHWSSRLWFGKGAHMEVSSPVTWGSNWAWGLPLIVLNSVVHVLGLALINKNVGGAMRGRMHHRHFMPLFAVAMSVTVLLVTVLHFIEAAVWATAYLLLAALPDPRAGMLYSLSALTTYGHASALLPDHWQMLGALEALNGVLLFGLTTAFLFAMIQEFWSLGRGNRRA
jgi:hypothetical protein